MWRLIPVLVVLLAACTAETRDLEVSTSVLSVYTTTTTTSAPTTPSTRPPAPTTTFSGPEAVLPDVATVIPVRPIRLADDDGTRRADVSTEDIVAWLRFANDVFSPARIGFSYDPAQGVVHVDDTGLNAMTGPSDPKLVELVERGNEIAAEYPGELVVLFRSGGGQGPSEVFGSRHANFVSMGEWDDDAVCGEPDRGALAHAIGGYLALTTTFSSTHATVREAAGALADAVQDPSVFDGDGFGDTPPDPGVYDVYRCSSEVSVRIGGLDFELPRENIMSGYSQRSRLTLLQVDRVRWMLGVRAERDMAAPSNTPFPTALEAEDTLVGTGGPCGLASTQSMLPWLGYQWAGTDQLLAASEAGCNLEFLIPVEEPGNYEVVALATKAPGYGAVQFTVDGETLHFEDFYAPALIASGPLSLGVTTLEAPSAIISVEVVGTNAASTGAEVGLDGFALRPAG